MLMGLGGIVLAGAVMILAMPKAMHAAVEALVQVANTVSAPAITQPVPTLASQLITLVCDSVCSLVQPGGGTNSPSAYVVPAGQSLVITDLEIHPSIADGNLDFEIKPVTHAPKEVYQSWSVPQDGNTHEFEFSSGIIWPAGQSITVLGGAPGFIRGYLTHN